MWHPFSEWGPFDTFLVVGQISSHFILKTFNHSRRTALPIWVATSCSYTVSVTNSAKTCSSFNAIAELYIKELSAPISVFRFNFSMLNRHPLRWYGFYKYTLGLVNEYLLPSQSKLPSKVSKPFGLYLLGAWVYWVSS